MSPAARSIARRPTVATARARAAGELEPTPEREDAVMTAVAELKRAHRAIWAAGDYAAVAQVIDELPPRDLLARLEITPGQEVLDVATGTGNIAIRAAAAGAQVVGLDLTPELFRHRPRAGQRARYGRRLGRGRRRASPV